MRRVSLDARVGGLDATGWGTFLVLEGAGVALVVID